jgi:putative endonuclease
VSFYVYIVASRRNGTLYVGMTDNLAHRIWEHKSKARPGFTAKYGCDQLVWFEVFETRAGAFQRERQVKEWQRRWKLRLIEDLNPTWAALYDRLTG